MAHEQTKPAVVGWCSVQRACTPTRAALMTARYNIRYGFASGVLKPAKPYGLPTNETILPQYLNELGFESHMVREQSLYCLQSFRVLGGDPTAVVHVDIVPM